MRNFIILLPMWLISCTTNTDTPSEAPPLVDGNCSEYAKMASDSIQLSDDVMLHIYQDAHYVWLCYCYPKESFGTLDLQLISKKYLEPINLHVSAQLGEWPANNPELAPQTPQSDKWWEIEGWTANPVWLNGRDTTTNQINFKNANARELQLSKKRFGRGLWEIQMEIRSIKGRDGEFYNIQFPEDGSYKYQAN